MHIYTRAQTRYEAIDIQRLLSHGRRHFPFIIMALLIVAGCRNEPIYDPNWNIYATTPQTDGEPYIDNDEYYVPPNGPSGTDSCTINDLPSSNCIN